MQLRIVVSVMSGVSDKNRKCISNFREVLIPISILISALSNYVICSFSVICVEFGIQLGNVVNCTASSASGEQQKYRRCTILAVFFG